MEQHNHKRALVTKGSDIKIAITVTSLGDGVKISDSGVDLQVKISVLNHDEYFQKSALTPLTDDTYILPLNTSIYPRGDMFITTQIIVPDTDFPGGTRTEVQTNDTGITLI